MVLHLELEALLAGGSAESAQADQLLRRCASGACLPS